MAHFLVVLSGRWSGLCVWGLQTLLSVTAKSYTGCARARKVTVSTLESPSISRDVQAAGVDKTKGNDCYHAHVGFTREQAEHAFSILPAWKILRGRRRPSPQAAGILAGQTPLGKLVLFLGEKKSSGKWKGSGLGSSSEYF